LFLFSIFSFQDLPKKNRDGKMNFTDNWARIFVMNTFLFFGEAQIIGGIVPNLNTF
tara:strand:- start:242 stop:409 length:168 start_codon:yes stop_codon:yes gene_type:complete